MEVSVKDILEARDNRVKRQAELLKEFNAPLICFTMNIAGPVKISDIIKQGFNMGVDRINTQARTEALKILHFEKSEEFTGCTAFFSVDCDAKKLKRLTTEIEDSSPLGRLFDIDVLNKDGKKVSREELSLPARKCLLCEKDALICSSVRAHTVEQLQEKTADILNSAINEEYSDFVAQTAVRALLFEVCTTPKPGLVDCKNSGRHIDMDVFTFLSSASSLFPYFKKCVDIGIKTAALSPKETFNKLRFEGKVAEMTMYNATDGVNTHKGAIFSMGIFCGAMGRCKNLCRRPETIAEECAKAVSGISNEFDTAAATTGTRLYGELGIKGIRGQAEAGFPVVINIGYPALKKGVEQGLTLNFAGCAALLKMMCELEDTNALKHTDKKTYDALIEKVKAALNDCEFPNEDTLAQLDKEFTENNVSPGGSADLLSICYFLYFLFDEK